MKLLCMDFGGSAVKYGMLDWSENREDYSGGELSGKGSLPNTFSNQEELLEAVDYLVSELMKNTEAVDGIAVSYCGELDHETGLIYSPGVYRYNRNLNLKNHLEKHHGLPVSVENDGNAAMLAEWQYGSLKGLENAAMLVLGSGVAGAFILDGHLHTGKRGFSGFLSMLRTGAKNENGKAVSSAGLCGSRFLIREYLRRSGKEDDTFDGRRFFDCYKSEDPVAREVLQEYAGNVADMIYNLQLILEVEAFAIGGGISAQDALIEAIREKMDELMGSGFIQYVQLPKPEVFRAAFSNDANLIGAAYWFRTLYGPDGKMNQAVKRG